MLMLAGAAAQRAGAGWAMSYGSWARIAGTRYLNPQPHYHRSHPATFLPLKYVDIIRKEIAVGLWH